MARSAFIEHGQTISTLSGVGCVEKGVFMCPRGFEVDTQPVGILLARPQLLHARALLHPRTTALSCGCGKCLVGGNSIN